MTQWLVPPIVLPTVLALVVAVMFCRLAIGF
jgi:hypothetical protein